MRLIDSEFLEQEINKWINPPGDGEYYCGYDDALTAVQDLVADLPTITPPNETPPCYQPDGDGCAYQCYDGDDEPIDKCKECPLCYSDKQRHHAPPNEPLTPDELREMDGEPVWVEDVKHWALIDIEKGGQWDGVPFAIWAENGMKFTYNIKNRGLHCYRRPPEGEA